MTTVISGSSPSITFSDSTTQTTAFTSTPSVTTITTSSDATINGQTVGRGGGSPTYSAVFGLGAMAATNTGDNNNAFGASALAAVTTGTRNSAFGRASLTLTVGGNDNSAYGHASLQSNSSGNSNTAIGSSALSSNTTASSNVALGYNAGNAITTGYANTIIGTSAATAITTGNNNIFIGNSVVASSSGVGQVIMMHTTGGTDKGTNTGFISPNGGGVYQGNNSSSWSTTSDFRLKKNIVDNTEGLDVISQIRVRNFEYRTEEEVTELPAHTVIDKQGVQLGVIAQELREVCPDCVKEESTGVLAVDSDNIFWHMVNAIKDLKALVDAQATEIAELKAKVG